MKYKALYRKKGANPFSENVFRGNMVSITSRRVRKDIPIEKIEEFAKKRTPPGYEFIEVIPIKGG